MASEPASNKPGTNTNERAIALVFAGLLAGVVIMAFALAFLLDSLSWDWERLTGSERPNLIEAWRNLGLIALGVVGVGLATWRSILAHQQNKNAIAQRLISERGMNVDRYQKGAQMLESEELSVRIAGIYGLRELAISDPEESYIIVQSLLFAFVREKSKPPAPEISHDVPDSNTTITPTSHQLLSADVVEALTAAMTVRAALPNASKLEGNANWRPNLKGADLSRAEHSSLDLPRSDLSKTNLAGMSIFQANLSEANLYSADLSESFFISADFKNAILFDANLSEAYFSRSNLSGASLAYAKLVNTGLVSADLTGADLSRANLSLADLRDLEIDENTELDGIWAWEGQPPQNMPPEIADAIIYRDPAESDDDLF